VWTYSTQAEVFALNNLLLSLLVLLTARFTTAPRARAGALPLAGAFTFGLGMSNQHTIVLSAAPLALAVALHPQRSLLRPAPLATLAGCGALGLTPYLYLTTAGEAPGRGAWGDPASAAGLAAHALRRDYGTFRLFSGAGRTPQGLPALARGAALYVASLPRQGLVVAPALAVAGAGLLLRRARTRAAGAGLAAAWGVYVAAFHALANLPLDDAEHGALFREGLFLSLSFSFFLFPLSLPFFLFPLSLPPSPFSLAFPSLPRLPCARSRSCPPPRAVHARFWLQPNTLLAPVTAVGAAAAARAALRACVGASRAARAGSTLAAAAAAGVAAQGCLHWRACDRSREWAVWESGWAVLDAAPLGAILMVKGDLNTNAARYLTQCEGARPVRQPALPDRMLQLGALRARAPCAPFLTPSPRSPQDLAQLDLSHASYAWFARRQAARNFPHVAFPGRRLTRHRAGVPGGFQLEHLLAANLHTHPVLPPPSPPSRTK
jgi:hypothetical protein